MSSLKNALRNYLFDCLEQNEDYFVPKKALEMYSMELGYLGDNCARRLRELEAEREIEGRENEHGVKEYKYIRKIYAV